MNLTVQLREKQVAKTVQPKGMNGKGSVVNKREM